ncbi:hypothetical protein [Bifidobacterium miconisargentati]|uniref:hypothetical protein n=1 Tax=Bifidobacterium miconisargentati TaxID=2834437 RepID=UPI001BDCF17C|nr:hypothetical protein [Bifidobacterium miconisargentati]MBW3089215.1 hypothetical protein [Bifidobacterium miconisargentati]
MTVKDRKRVILVVLACLLALTLIIVSGMFSRQRARQRQNETAQTSSATIDVTRSTSRKKDTGEAGRSSAGQEYPGLSADKAGDVCGKLAPKALTAYLDADADLTGWFAENAEGLQWRSKIIAQPDADPQGFLSYQADDAVSCSVYQGLPFAWTLTYEKDKTMGWIITRIDPPSEGAFTPSKGTGPQTADGQRASAEDDTQ